MKGSTCELSVHNKHAQAIKDYLITFAEGITP